MAQRKTQKDFEIEEGASLALLALVRLLARQAASEQFESSLAHVAPPRSGEA